MSDLNIAMILRFVDKATAPAKAALRQVDRASNGMMAKGQQQLALSGRQIAATQARSQALLGEATALAASGAALIALTEPAIEAERRMAEVSKVVDFEASDGLSILQKDIQELVTSGGLVATAEGVMDIVAAAGRMGVVDANLPDARKRAELLEFAVAASKMAAAFGISADEAGTTLARWRQNLNLSQEQALALGDTVNFLGNTYATNEADILEVINRQGVVAKTAGLAANEIAALSATLLAAGASPEIAATGLKNFTNALVIGESATKRQREVYAELGIDATELAKRMQVDATGGILMVLEAFKQIEPYRQSSLVGDLFGEEGKGAIMPLIANTQLLKDAFAETADTAALLGLMEDEYQRQAATTYAQRQRLFEYIKGVSKVVGGAVLPQLNEVMASLMPIIGQITQWAAENPELIQQLFKIAILLFGMRVALLAGRMAVQSLTMAYYFLNGVIAVVVWTIGAAMKIFLIFGRVLRGVYLALRLVGRGLIWMGRAALSNPIVLLIAAIAAGAYLIYQNWDGIVAYFTEKFDRIKAAFDEGFLQGLIQLLNEVNPFMLLLDLMSGITKAVFDEGVKFIDSLHAGISSRIGAMVDAVKAKLTDIVPSWLLDAWNWVAGGDDSATASTGQVPGKELGGPVRAGQVYRWLEKGEEYFVPNTDGKVVSNRDVRAMRAGGGSRSFSIGSIHVHAAPGMSARDVAREVARQLEEKARAAGFALDDGGEYA